MAGTCVNANCTYSTTGICARKAEFANPEVECIDLLEGRTRALVNRAPSVPPPPNVDAAVSDNAITSEDNPPSPGRFWSGLALGGDEAGAMLMDSRTRLFTVLGEKNRGKTCFLTALYIQLANGFTSGFPWRFCGSRSLIGFQRLANDALQWKGGEDQIVPRTTHASFRQPSFLHLALKEHRHVKPKTVHTLLTDMPGEWFTKWISHGAGGLPETLEFLPRSDGFLIVIDVHQIMNDRVYRADTAYLLDRLLTFLIDSPELKRPVALALTKVDKVSDRVFKHGCIPIPNKETRRQYNAWGALGERLEPLFKKMQGFAPTVPWDIFPVVSFSRPLMQPIGVLAPITFLLQMSGREKPMDCVVSKPEYRTSFFEVFREETPT